MDGGIAILISIAILVALALFIRAHSSPRLPSLPTRNRALGSRGKAKVIAIKQSKVRCPVCAQFDCSLH